MPSLIELKLGDAGTSGWNSIPLPAGTPAENVNRLYDEINAVLDMPAWARMRSRPSI